MTRNLQRNKALAESINSDKRIFLFEPIRDRKPYTHRLIAELSCIDYEYTTEFDKNSQTSRKMFKFIFSGNSNNIGYKAQVKKDLLEELANELEEEMNEMNVSTKPRKISTSSYKVSQKQTLERKQKENELVLEYKEFVESSGFKAQHSQIDLIVENDNLKEFIEAKILKSATKQLTVWASFLLLSFGGHGAEKLALLFDRKPDEKTISFVHKYNVEIIYKKRIHSAESAWIHKEISRCTNNNFDFIFSNSSLVISPFSSKEAAFCRSSTTLCSFLLATSFE